MGSLKELEAIWAAEPRHAPSWDHLAHLTFSPHWSINARVWAKVTIGLYPAALTKLSISCPNLLSYSHSNFTQHFGFPLQRWRAIRCITYSSCIQILLGFLHASVPRLTPCVPPTRAFKMRQPFVLQSCGMEKHLVSWQHKWEHFIKPTKWTSEVR